MLTSKEADCVTFGQCNEGIFREILRLRVDAGDKVLEEHLRTAAKQTSHISETNQNEVIGFCRIEMQEKILSEVTVTKCVFYIV